MFRSRITKWGLDKNIKGLEAEAIMRKKTKRAREGKESAFELRGRPVDLRHVEQHLKRKRICFEGAISPPESAATTPPGLFCFTPRGLFAFCSSM